jgi:hypothetical protein
MKWSFRHSWCYIMNEWIIRFISLWIFDGSIQIQNGLSCVSAFIVRRHMFAQEVGFHLCLIFGLAMEWRTKYQPRLWFSIIDTLGRVLFHGPINHSHLKMKSHVPVHKLIEKLTFHFITIIPFWIRRTYVHYELQIVSSWFDLKWTFIFVDFLSASRRLSWFMYDEWFVVVDKKRVVKPHLGIQR